MPRLNEATAQLDYVGMLELLEVFDFANYSCADLMIDEDE